MQLNAPTASCSRVLPSRTVAHQITLRHVAHLSLVPLLSYKPGKGSLLAATNKDELAVNVREFADIISSQQGLEGEEKHSLAQIAKVLDAPIATVKAMAFKKKTILNLLPDEVQSKVKIISDVVKVSEAQAKKMVTIQPGLLFDTEKQASTLEYAIRSIAYDLGASREEVLELILNNPSVLHGRQMHLSVADLAHLAMLREPRGRVAE